MKIVIFGLTISSSWGNGHATLWRGLCKHLVRSGHTIVFFERDVPYYAGARDMFELPGGRLELFSAWDDIRAKARDHILCADAAIVTSYCPDAISATELILDQSHAISVFYDLDTPVTLSKLQAGEAVPYIGRGDLGRFDLVLSFTGGPRVLEEFRHKLGARNVQPLYGHVDADVHRPVPPQPHYRAALSYLGTYSEDRQLALETLFVEPARARQDLRFLIGGAQYPDSFPWSPNIYFVRHLPPSEHAPFFASSRLTLNITRRAMAEMGWCPSGRLFEAAACGVPLLSDSWDGFEAFFAPGEEILIAHDERDTLAALDADDAELLRIAKRARERALDQHSSGKRASELIALLEQTGRRGARQTEAEEI
ncbi:glycosyltransferase [Bradyrhizobium sp. Leo121]|uniref:CgeB family protein n=1 Tax=Bradyrhizobium sp. Leo121 TaxID=1571195 RepID=UPI001029FBB7|nr:glycosyltransferase [Bradyrhizobium sp. Leo121]RZN36197.1 glycosyltransferase [Bradyrhizobium sp. Leo121]